MSMISCPICDTYKNVKTYSEATHKYLMNHCSWCELEFTWPMKGPGAEYYEKAESRSLLAFNALGNMKLDWTERGWYYRQAMKALPVMKVSVLEVGCGVGEFVKHLDEKGYYPAGIDFDTRAIKLGWKLFGAIPTSPVSWENYMSPGEDCMSPGKVIFNSVCAFALLEHLDEPMRFLKEAKELTSQGGRLILSIPNKNRRFRRRDENDNPPMHLTRWTKKSLSIALHRAGWKVETIRHSPVSVYHFLTDYIRAGISKKAQDKYVTIESVSRWPSILAQFKIIIARIVTFPLDMVLRLMGYEGEILFAVARKTI